MHKKINLALIGCGKIAGEKKHIDAICKNDEFINLIYTCDKVIERAREKAEVYRRIKCKYVDSPFNENEIEAITDYRIILDDDSVDACVVATDSGSHYKIAIDCLKAGKHVLVEKPMALSITEANEMIKIAEGNNVKLAVSFQNRFNPLVQALRRKIEDESFGKIFYGVTTVRWNRNEAYYKEATWRGTWEKDGGVLMNQCIHSIDLLQWMLGGEIHSIYGILSNMNHPYIKTEDFGTAIVKFKSGRAGLIEGTSIIYPENLEESLSIFGEKGSVVISGTNLNKIEVWEFEDKSNPPELTESSSGHTLIYKDFAESIIFNRKPFIDGTEGKKSLELILGIYKSFKEKREIKFPIEDFSTKDMEDSLK